MVMSILKKINAQLLECYIPFLLTPPLNEGSANRQKQVRYMSVVLQYK